MALIPVTGLTGVLVGTPAELAGMTLPLPVGVLGVSNDQGAPATFVMKVGDGVSLWEALPAIADTSILFTEIFKTLLEGANSANGAVLLGADSLIPDEFLPTQFRARPIFVADIAARNALPLDGRGQMVIVVDATADATVASGGAYYVWNENADVWVKIGEAESLDIDFSAYILDGSSIDALSNSSNFVKMTPGERDKLELAMLNTLNYFIQSIGPENIGEVPSIIAKLYVSHSTPRGGYYAGFHGLYDSGISTPALLGTEAYATNARNTSAWSPSKQYMVIGKEITAADAGFGALPVRILSVNANSSSASFVTTTVSGLSYLSTTGVAVDSVQWKSDSSEFLVQQYESNRISIVQYSISDTQGLLTATPTAKLITSSERISGITYYPNTQVVALAGGRRYGSGWYSVLIGGSNPWFAGMSGPVLLNGSSSYAPSVSMAWLEGTSSFVSVAVTTDAVWDEHQGSIDVHLTEYSALATTVHTKVISVPPGETGPGRYTSPVLAPNGYIYAAPFRGSGGDILVIDPVEYRAHRTTMGIDFTEGFVDEAMAVKYTGGVLGNDGKIYYPPGSGTDFLIIDTVNNTATRSDLGLGLPATPGTKYRGTINCDGIIWVIPFISNTPIIRIDTTGPEPVATAETFGIDLSSNAGWWGTVKDLDGNVYATPFSATSILKINTALNTAERVTMGADLSGLNKWTGAAYVPSANKIIAVPYNAPDFLIIDVASQTATRDSLGMTLNVSAGYSDVRALSADNLLVMPYTQSDFIRIIWSGTEFSVHPARSAAAVSGGGFEAAYLNTTVVNGVLITPSSSTGNRRDLTVLFAKIAAGGITGSAISESGANKYKYTIRSFYKPLVQLSKNGIWMLISGYNTARTPAPTVRVFCYSSLTNTYGDMLATHSFSDITAVLFSENVYPSAADISNDGEYVIIGLSKRIGEEYAFPDNVSGVQVYKRINNSYANITQTAVGTRYLGVEVTDVSLSMITA